MNDELLKEILQELRFQSRVLAKLFNLTAKTATPCGEKKETPKIPPEVLAMIEGMAPAVKGTPMEKTFDNFANFLKGKTDGN